MKRIILILLVAVMGLTMFACGKEADETESTIMIEWSSDGSSGYMPDIRYSDDSTSSEAPPASDYPDTPADVTEDDGELAMSPDTYPYMLTDYKYLATDNSLDKLTCFSKNWEDYIIEQTGAESLDALWKSVWGGVKYGNVAPYSIIEIVRELNITRKKFAELNNGFGDKRFTEEEIDIIYSGDKKRIAEAFANPYAVIAGDWEIYPLRWIIENPASLYKEKQISFKALETAVNKLLETKWIYDEDDRAALKARVEEYRKLQ